MAEKNDQESSTPLEIAVPEGQNAYNLRDFEQPAPAEDAEESAEGDDEEAAAAEEDESASEEAGDDDGDAEEESGDEDAEEDAGDDEEGEGEEGDEENLNPRTPQGRINQAIRRQREAERREQEAARRAETAEAELAKLREGGAAEETPAAPPVPDMTAFEPSKELNEANLEILGERPDPLDYDMGESDTEYLSDLSAWKGHKRVLLADQQKEERTAFAQQQQAALTAQDAWTAKKKAAEEKYPNFQKEVVDTASDVEAPGKWLCTPAMGLAIRESENAADVAHYLKEHPDEAKRISQMSDLSQARAIGMLEAQLFEDAEDAGQTEEAEEEPPTREPKVKTGAPPPPPARVRGTGGKFENPERSLYKQALKAMQ